MNRIGLQQQNTLWDTCESWNAHMIHTVEAWNHGGAVSSLLYATPPPQ